VSFLHCDRCGTLFGTDGRFMAANVDVLSEEARETLEQVLLCPSCTRAVGDDLTLETTVYDHD
jgi:uncharacterized C2H2 Zn-finger protein